MLDIIFWVVSALVMWYTWDSWRHQKVERHIQNVNNEQMESL